MGIIYGGTVIEGSGQRTIQQKIGENVLGTGGVLAAATDNGAQQVITTGIIPLDRPRRITATAGGTAGDIKAITVTIAGVAPGGEVISEVLSAFTVDTPGTVTGTKVFERVTSITIPAHDGTGATTSISATGTPKVATTTGIHAAVTDTGVQVDVTTGIIQPDVPRGITATAGGTAADIKAIAVIITGTNIEDKVISETLPVFTVDTPGTVTGVKAFKTVTNIRIPAHDGTGATTAIGFSDILGLDQCRPRKSIVRSYLNDVLEGTAATEVADSDEIEKNTADLNSALNSVQVVIDYVPNQ